MLLISTMTQKCKAPEAKFFCFLILCINVAQCTLDEVLRTSTEMTTMEESTSSTHNQSVTMPDSVHLPELAEHENSGLPKINIHQSGEHKDIKSLKENDNKAIKSDDRTVPVLTNDIIESLIIQGVTASSQNDISLSYSIISPTPIQTTTIGMSSLLSVNLSPEPDNLQFCERVSSFNTEIFQIISQCLSSKAILFQRSTKDVSPDIELLQTSEKEFSLTDMIQTDVQKIHFEGDIMKDSKQRTSQQVLQILKTIGSFHDEDVVITMFPESTDAILTTHDLYSTGVTVSPSPVTDSMASSSAHITEEAGEQGKRNDIKTVLNVVTLKDNAGHITSPGFGTIAKYPSNVNDTYCFSLNSLSSQSLLLSFPYFYLEGGYGPDCDFDYLMLFVRDEHGKEKEVWRKCGSPMMPVEILNDLHVCFKFISDRKIQRGGFMVSYSVLPGSPRDYQLDNGFINCSNIDSYHRSLHFDCNLALECEDKQDEMNCSYSNKECPGLVATGDRYYTNNLRRNITWYDAYKECSNQDQIVISPQTYKEWNAFVKVIKNIPKIRSAAIYVGLQTTSGISAISSLYKYIWKWSTDITAFNIYLRNQFYKRQALPACAVYFPHISKRKLLIESCIQGYDILVMCQSQKALHHQRPDFPRISRQSIVNDFPVSVVQCPSGHFVHDFLVCDSDTFCYHGLSPEKCLKQSQEPIQEQFSCFSFSSLSVHYTLVCDFRNDCPDASDELFCIHDKCAEDVCKNGQCIKYEQRCDGFQQCTDASDENCFEGVKPSVVPPPSPPVIVNFDGKGYFAFSSINDTTCPETHFKCQRSYCLPVYLRCNEVNDCSDHEDEHSNDCGISTCAGYFRCRGSNVCVHPEHVCDGVFHCPKHDDEMLCNMTCPPHCTCQGLAFFCTSDFNFASYPALRYLHIDDFSITGINLTSNTYLILLRLSNCQIKTLSMLQLNGLRNLQTLDLRDNSLTFIVPDNFVGLENLRSLVLSRNPLTEIAFSSKINKLVHLDLSYTLLHTVKDTTLASIPNITYLNLSNSALNEIVNSFQSTSKLQYLDLRKTQLDSYPIYMLRYLSDLKFVWADAFKFCCRSALPEGFNLDHCDAPKDNIASCDDLLRSTTYKTFLWIIASFALIGNAGSFVARLLMGRESFLSSFGLFVLNLSIADFLMGVYLTMIGTADQMFQGQYWWRSDIWKRSVACKTAGFLSLLSSEVSAFFICLITVDRLCVLRCPFSRFHFGHKSAMVACFIAWFAGFLLALVPLMPFTSHWDFYGQTGICLPLPFSRRGAFTGYFYSFGVMIVLNFILFVLIAFGQVIIYQSVRVSSKSTIRRNTKSRDASIARRLITIVLSDFACWFPTGVLGLWAFAGNDVHSDINVTVAIFVMPFNAALNPFLYTLNLVLDKRQKAAEARLMQRFQTEVSQTDTRPKSHTKDTALDQIHTWLQKGLLSPSDFRSCLQQMEVPLNHLD